MLVAANIWPKDNQRTVVQSSNDDRFSQLIVNIVSAVLDGYCASTSPAGHHSDGFAGIAAKRKQKRIEIFVVRFDPLNDIFSAFFSYG